MRRGKQDREKLLAMTLKKEMSIDVPIVDVLPRTRRYFCNKCRTLSDNDLSFFLGGVQSETMAYNRQFAMWRDVAPLQRKPEPSKWLICQMDRKSPICCCRSIICLSNAELFSDTSPAPGLADVSVAADWLVLLQKQKQKK